MWALDAYQSIEICQCRYIINQKRKKLENFLSKNDNVNSNQVYLRFFFSYVVPLVQTFFSNF